MNASAACSVVVCTLRRPALLERCLASLAAQETFEVVVVDNSAGDRETAAVSDRAGARHVVEPRLGLSRARNAGARAARGRAVLYLDDDAVAAPGLVATYNRAFADPSVVVATGRVLPPEGDGTAGIYNAMGGWDAGSEPFRVDRTSPAWFERANFGALGVGTNMAFRSSLFEHGFAFREDLGLPGVPGEEHYAFFSLVRDGASVTYLPDAVVRHEVPAEVEEFAALRWRMALGAAAYMTMLVVEERGFRRATVRYAAGALRGNRREWRAVAADVPLVPRRRQLAAAALGPSIYLRAKLDRWSRRRDVLRRT